MLMFAGIAAGLVVVGIVIGAGLMILTLVVNSWKLWK